GFLRCFLVIIIRLITEDNSRDNNRNDLLHALKISVFIQKTKYRRIAGGEHRVWVYRFFSRRQSEAPAIHPRIYRNWPCIVLRTGRSGFPGKTIQTEYS